MYQYHMMILNIELRLKIKEIINPLNDSVNQPLVEQTSSGQPDIKVNMIMRVLKI
jgi:hypothetical protein